MFSETTFLLVFGLGALCMLLGFFLVLRGVGASDSESTIKLIGIEIRASRVGPGVLFALFGVVLVVTALSKQPSGESQASKSTTAAGAAPSAASAPAPAAEAAAPPAPAAQTAPSTPSPASVAATPAPDLASQREQEMQMIRRFLADVVVGQCNEEVLGPAPLTACRQQIGMMQPSIASVGPVQNISYLSSGVLPGGIGDRFLVQHAGTTATWTAVLGPDGKFSVLVTP